MKRYVAIILAAMAGAVALQAPPAVSAQKWTLHESRAAASPAEASRRTQMFPNVQRVEPTITCPLLEGVSRLPFQSVARLRSAEVSTCR
jgi:hypothetical protein